MDQIFETLLLGGGVLAALVAIVLRIARQWGLGKGRGGSSQAGSGGTGTHGATTSGSGADTGMVSGGNIGTGLGHPTTTSGPEFQPTGDPSVLSSIQNGRAALDRVRDRLRRSGGSSDNNQPASGG